MTPSAKNQKGRRGFRAWAEHRGIGGVTLAKFAVITILAAIGAWLAFILAVSGIARSKAPDRALAFVPWEGNALANKADMQLLSGQKIPAKSIAATARTALRNSPLNAKAVRLLAVSAALEGDVDKTRKLVHASARLTRRDPLTQVFLIEEAVGQGDLKKAMFHYDLALRTSSIAPQILYPRLLKVIEHSDGRAALKPYLRSGEQWTRDFICFAKDQSKDLTHVVDLMLETGGSPDPKLQPIQRAALISALADRQQYAQIPRLLRPVPDAAAALTSVGLETLDQDRGLGSAGWEVLDDAEAGASGRVDTKGVSMTIYANPGTSRPVARKLLFLTPGRYRFSFNLAPVERGEGRAIGWQLRCVQPQGAPLWRLDGVLADGKAEWTIEQCRVQLLEITATGGRGQTGMEAVLSGVSLVLSGAVVPAVQRDDAALAQY